MPALNQAVKSSVFSQETTTGTVAKAWSFSPAFLSMIVFLFGLAHLVLTPPFQNADESAHYMRACKLAEGASWKGLNDMDNSMFPHSLIDDISGPLHGMQLIARNEKHPLFTARQVWSWVRRPTSVDKVWGSGWAGAAAYPPTAYVGQTIGMFLANILKKDHVPFLFYGGRLGNLLLFTTVIFFALRITPKVWRPFVFLYCMLPSVLFQSGSLSADALTTSLAILGFAIAASAFEGYCSKKLILCLALTCLICTCKYTYVLLPLIPLAVAFTLKKKTGNFMDGICFSAPAIFWLSCIAISLVYAIAFGGGTLHPSNACSAPVQLQWICAHPWKAVKVVFYTFTAEAGYYFRSFIGWIGWGFETAVPLPLQIAYAGMLLATASFAKRLSQVRLPIPMTSWIIACVSATVILVFAALYLSWTEIGYKLVIGVQGRYFIPALIFLGLLVPPAQFKNVTLEKINKLSLITAISMACVSTASIIYVFYI